MYCVCCKACRNYCNLYCLPALNKGSVAEKIIYFLDVFSYTCMFLNIEYILVCLTVYSVPK